MYLCIKASSKGNHISSGSPTPSIKYLIMEKTPLSASVTGSISDSTDATVSQLGRKRARSHPSSDTSSQKRAMSEDPKNHAQGEPQSSSQAGEIGTDHTYMREQRQRLDDEASNAERPISHFSPPEKFKLITLYQKDPMVVGQTWYLVSRDWYSKWERACLGENGKDDILSESQIGPVDNSMILDEAGLLDRSKQLIEGEDVEFVPSEAWKLLVGWYVFIMLTHLWL